MRVNVIYKGKRAHSRGGLTAETAHRIAARYYEYFGVLLGSALVVEVVPEDDKETEIRPP